MCACYNLQMYHLCWCCCWQIHSIKVTVFAINVGVWIEHVYYSDIIVNMCIKSPYIINLEIWCIQMQPFGNSIYGDRGNILLIDRVSSLLCSLSSDIFQCNITVSSNALVELHKQDVYRNRDNTEIFVFFLNILYLCYVLYNYNNFVIIRYSYCSSLRSHSLSSP